MDLAALRKRFEDSSDRADELLDEASDLWTEAASALEAGDGTAVSHLMRAASARIAVVAVLYEALASETEISGNSRPMEKPS